MKRRARSGEAAAFARSAALCVSEKCLLWPFGTNRNGYGRLGYGGAVISAPTAVCEILHGRKPSPLHQAAHACGTRLCVNGSHIRWATPLENCADTLRHGRTPRGERNGHAKLKIEQVRCIRALPQASRALARDMGISWGTMLRIRRGLRWLDA